MILSDSSIKRALQAGAIVIDPLPEEKQFASSAVDLRLGTEFHRYSRRLLGQKGVDVTVRFSDVDFKRLVGEFAEEIPLDSEGRVVLKPGDFVLCSTDERVYLPKSSGIAARVEGRSTLARLGVTVHLTAPTIHAGFDGVIALEVKNAGDLRVALCPGDRICQLIFELVEGDPETALTSIFHGQRSALGS